MQGLPIFFNMHKNIHKHNHSDETAHSAKGMSISTHLYPVKECAMNTFSLPNPLLRKKISTNEYRIVKPILSVFAVHISYLYILDSLTFRW